MQCPGRLIRGKFPKLKSVFVNYSKWNVDKGNVVYMVQILLLIIKINMGFHDLQYPFFLNATPLSRTLSMFLSWYFL